MDQQRLRDYMRKTFTRREFDVAEPNVIWASDLTYISTAEGWMYLCVILDLHSRRVIGWAMGSRMSAVLMIQALLMACMRRKPPKGLIFHSDRGSQYCSGAFRGHLSWSQAPDPHKAPRHSRRCRSPWYRRQYRGHGRLWPLYFRCWLCR